MVLPVTPPKPLSFKTREEGGAGGAHIQIPGPAAPPPREWYAKVKVSCTVHSRVMVTPLQGMAL